MISISLNGVWQACMAGTTFETSVPGCLEMEAPRRDYGGETVMQRKFTVEQAMPRYELCCGAVSYKCSVFVNGIFVGEHEGMWDAFRLDVTKAVRVGENEIEFRIVKPGYRDEDPYHLRAVLSGFIPDVGCTFGGIWEDIRLEGYEDFCLLGSYGDSYGIHLSIRALKDMECQIMGRLCDSKGGECEKIEIMAGLKAGDNAVLAPLAFDSREAWSPQKPCLYSYNVSLACGNERQEAEGKLAIRTVEPKGKDILVGGEPVYWRGILHWGYYPDRFIPRASDEEIRQELLELRKMGFNAVKHCLYVPGENYLRLCDEMGIMCWIELPIWLPRPSAELEGRVRREFAAITDRLLGHPCVCIVTLGCEMNSGVEASLLEEMYKFVKGKLKVLVRDNSGSGECYGGLAIDFADFFDYHFYGELQNMENLMEVFTPTWRSYRPWLFGEYCDSDTMRDLKPLREALGVKEIWWESANPERNPISLLKPDFFLNQFEERLAKTRIREKYSELKRLSYDHALVHRKVTVEQTRAFPEIAGYDITSIRDVPIATSGVFDDCGKPKFDGAEFRRFNSDVVLVPAFDLTRTWINADRVYTRERYSFRSGAVYGLHVLLSNYGEKELCGRSVACRLTDEKGKVLHEEKAPMSQAVRRGEVKEVFYLHFPLPQTEVPRNLRLFISLDGECENVLPVFLYPAVAERSGEGICLFDTARTFFGLQWQYKGLETLADGQAVPESCKLVLTDRMTPAIREYLEKGGRVFLCQTMDGNFPTRPIAFWREGMAEAFAHPLLHGLERRDCLEDLRYFGVTPDMALDSAKAAELGYKLVSPIVRRYDCREWFESEYLAEYALGKGRLIATALKISGGQGKETPFLRGNVFGRYLLDRTADYLTNLKD